jgi:glycosyltransferase involved in cell wall biosynthesis
MKHIILTRFNVVMPGWNSQVNLEPSWLNERIKLFEEICLPSVAAQTNQNFEWLVFFDSKTPDAYISKINKLLEKFRFQPIYIDVFDIKAIRNNVFKYSTEDSMLLTSRLDSDDVLAIDYVKVLQSISDGITDKRIINFDNGAILFSKGNSHSLYQYEDMSNPFTSLLEPFEDGFSTILALKHTELHTFAEVVHIKGKPMWLQLVHGGNVSNRVRGKRVRINQYNDGFIYMRTISSIVKENDFAIFLDNKVLGTYRNLRDFFRMILKYIYFYFK